MAKTDSLNIAILGAGYIGCYLGGLLAHAGCQVTFIGRDRMRWALRNKGITLTHYQRSKIYIPPHAFEFVTEPDGAKDADIVLVCVKSQDTVEAAQALKPHARHDAMIISFQNGIGNADRLSDILPQQVVLGAVVPFNVTAGGTSIFHCGTEGDLIIQTHHDKRFKPCVKAFRKAGQGVKIERNIEHVQWGKLLVNLNNGMNALWGGTLKTALVQRPYRLALAAMMEEALIVTQKAGQEIKTFGKVSPQKTIKILRQPNFLFNIVMDRVLKIDETARSSMLEDLEGGKACEIDYLQGEVVRIAKMSRQSAPINAAVMKRVKAAFATGKSPNMSGQDLWDLVKSVKAG